MRFRVGDRVEWSSHSKGVVKRHRGVVVVVVPRGADPGKRLPRRLKMGPGYGRVRDEESYVVQEGNHTRVKWPRVEQLRSGKWR